MYNLIVTAEDGVWDNTTYRIARSRFLEYTNEDIASKFRDINSDVIQKLKEIPCLFAYEGSESDVYVGYIKNITSWNNYGSIKFEFEIDREIGPIPFNNILIHKDRLDIREWEVNRTHWAIKDEDLIEVLSDIVDENKLRGKITLLIMRISLVLKIQIREYLVSVVS